MSFSWLLDRESMWSFIILIGYRNGVHQKKVIGMASIGIIRKMVEREIDSVKDLYKQ